MSDLFSTDYQACADYLKPETYFFQQWFSDKILLIKPLLWREVDSYLSQGHLCINEYNWN